MHTLQEQYKYMVSRGMKPSMARVYAQLNISQGIDAIPGCIVTYAKPKERSTFDPSASIAKFYDECRAKYPNLNQVFVGD